MFKNPLAKLSLQAAGWRIDGAVPREKKFVCIAYPHSSNWDGLLMVAMTQAIGLKMSFMIKDSWLKGPMSAPMKAVGAIGIDRRRANNVVDQMIQQFNSREEFALFVPPEGTRSRSDYWKSGFYHIALGAEVPVVPGYIDFAKKRGGFGEPIWLTGDVHADMDNIRAFYQEGGYKAHAPEQVGPIRLREEDQSPSA